MKAKAHVDEFTNLGGAIMAAERKLADRTLVQSGQRLRAWAVSNARVEPKGKGNAITITKQASGSAKIDPLMAASTRSLGCRQTRRRRSQAFFF